MFYLIQSFVYFDNDIDDKFKKYPTMSLAQHLDQEDPNKSLCH
jgi:hypothetical protein